jgi:diguanylate cyclase (GGDEF)-like protein
MKKLIHRTYINSVRTKPGPLGKLLVDGGIHLRYQPICNIYDSSVFGYEALSRGPEGHPLESPQNMLLSAIREGLLLEFEIETILLALDSWDYSDNKLLRLFLNISASTLVKIFLTEYMPQARELIFAEKTKHSHNRTIVFEITEHEKITDIEDLVLVLNTLTNMGFEFAMDDFGEGHSSLKLWSQIKPHYVKIDKYFTKNLANHPENLLTIKAMVQIGQVFDSKLIAEGIENQEDFRVIRDLDIPYGQGFLIGPPGTTLEDTRSISKKIAQDGRISVFPMLKKNRLNFNIRSLEYEETPCATRMTTCLEVFELFSKNKQLYSIAVVDEHKKPIGLIDKIAVADKFSVPYFKEINGKKSCVELMNSSIKVLEADSNLQDLLDVLSSEDQKYLSSGFVVVRKGRYVGLCSAEHVVRVITELRIEAARHENPLTSLPGNLPITQHIDRLLASKNPFVACYVDLNNFKQFNDKYGYQKGDMLLQLLAAIIVQNCDNKLDFVGHVGGDDFVMLMQSQTWENRCIQIIEQLNRDAVKFYTKQDQEEGGITAEDRHGVTRFFPFTTLAIGVVLIDGSTSHTGETISELAAVAKKHAKLNNTTGIYVLNSVSNG